MLLSKATYNWGVHKAINLEEANREQVFVTPSLRHCSNKYKLAREGEKDKDEDSEKVNNQIFDKERCSLKGNLSPVCVSVNPGPCV